MAKKKYQVKKLL